ncbi:hypothetical protein [Stutzerimonas stutzeri]|uniref:hypothetical protein n=1 Tax=Stutzerimonas stutzeri TaxID=316 RepID=UPI0015E3414D|nr:hypothetical protein [Stutzerimonas stutzeri]MBA1262398.1 hypothetical protein [Stutzerimonas stutzeri]
MKKTTLFLASLMLSSLAWAVEFPASGQLEMDVCNNLNENVSINLTTGVVAAVDCDPTRVAIAACHTAGMVKSRTVGQKTIQVSDTSEGAAAGATRDHVVSCTVGTADPDCEMTDVNGAAFATATTTRGTVNIAYPGNGACDGATKADTVAKTLI